METLRQLAMDYLMSEGACAVGIATIETLAGGPPSTDLGYVLPGARSAACFALPLDQGLIEPFLSKKDRLSHERNNYQTNTLASGTALELANFISQKGYHSVPIAANFVYRRDLPKGTRMMPDISLRYLAVRSGVGHFGLSGNVLTKDYGAAIILGGIVSSAPFSPTDALPEEESYCDECRLCLASCASGFMHETDLCSVSLGGSTFRYSSRRSYYRCEFVCGGYSGLHSSGKWSTWSPGRFKIPDTDDDILSELLPGFRAFNKWPEIQGGRYHVMTKKKLLLTCGNCQLVCHPRKEERIRRHKMLIESGVVVQNNDGGLEAVSAPAAQARMESMSPEQRVLYEGS